MTGIEGWAIVNLGGMTQTAGYVAEASVAGAEVLRVDTPVDEGAQDFITQFYSGDAFRSMAFCTEALVRQHIAAWSALFPLHVQKAMEQIRCPGPKLAYVNDSLPASTETGEEGEPA